MPNPRDVLEKLPLPDLKGLAEASGVAIADKRKASSVADALEALDPAHLRVLLVTLSMDVLKDACRALGIDDSGREKALLVDRLIPLDGTPPDVRPSTAVVPDRKATSLSPLGKLTQADLERHLWSAANILRGKTAGQDYKNYILSLMFYKRLCDQWECEADDAIAELERQQGRTFSEKEKAVFRKRGEHRFQIPDGSRWGDVKAASTNLGEVLTKAMRAVAGANDELRGVFTVDWNQPAPDSSGKPLIPNEVVHALVQHFNEHDLSNRSVPSDVLGRAYEYLIKQFADDAGAKAGEFFTPPEVVDTLVRILEPRPGDTVYDPTAGSGGMLVHAADFLREQGQHATSARYFAQEMNWGNAAIGKINSVLHGLEADIKAGASTITDPQFLDGGRVQRFSLVLANFPFSDEFWWLKPEQQTDDKKKKDKLKQEIFGKEGFKDPFGRFGRGTGFQAPPAGYGDYAFILHILASLTESGRAGIVCPQGSPRVGVGAIAALPGTAQ